jgi:hypothetical protein
MQRAAVGAGEAGGGGGLAQAAAQPFPRDTSAAFDEHEVGVSAVPRVGQRPLRAAVAHQGVERGEGGPVQRHRSFGA